MPKEMSRDKKIAKAVAKALGKGTVKTGESIIDAVKTTTKIGSVMGKGINKMNRPIRHYGAKKIKKGLNKFAKSINLD